jgi:hypothetical protein
MMKSEIYTSFHPIEDINSFEENDGEKWKDHIRDMVSGSTSEVIKAVDDMLKVITNLPIELQPYPYYTEHFRTHPRNVLRLAFEIMSIKPEIFDEKDVLIITLATLIHDLGQLPPGKGKKKGEPERLKKLFITGNGRKGKIAELLEKEKDLKRIFFKEDDLTTLGQIILYIAMYHPKHMPLDNKYLENADQYVKECHIKNDKAWEEIKKKFEKMGEEIKKKNNLHNKLKKTFGEEEIQHYLKLAAILKLADGCDVQIYRDINKFTYSYKIDYIFKKLKDKDKRRKSINAYLRDICIKNVKIKRIKISGDTAVEDNNSGDNYVVMIANFEEENGSISTDIYEKILNYLKRKEETSYIIEQLERITKNREEEINGKRIKELLEDAFIDVCTEFLLARKYLIDGREEDEDINIKGVIIAYEKNKNEYKIIDGFHLQVDS